MKQLKYAFLLTSIIFLDGCTSEAQERDDSNITLVDIHEMKRQTNDRFSYNGGKISYKGAETAITVSGTDATGQVWTCTEIETFDKKDYPDSQSHVAWKKSSYNRQSADMTFPVDACHDTNNPDGHAVTPAPKNV